MLKRHLILLALNIIMVLTDNIYRQFNLTVTDVELCRGPKHKDCSVVKTQITSHSVMQYDVNVTQSFILSKGKMLAVSNGKDFLRFQMKKPCEHLFLKALLQSLYNITKECLILKGRYQYNIDVQNLAQTYYGGRFLLGKYIFKSLFYGDECNFYCVNIKINLF